MDKMKLMRQRYLLLVALVLLLSCGCEETATDSKAPGTVGLEVGQVAPILQGTDTTGQSIKLSDYRGKVVMVDFWATWCGPCKEMIPHEKELARRLEGQPFVLLGVSADYDQDELKTYMSQKSISWTNVFDGAGGPIARAWRIEGFPTIFVIDAKGVIRFKQVGYNPGSMSKIDNAIDKLLKDMRY
jgi:thiol-disulfide isomerase/thioredoxin